MSKVISTKPKNTCSDCKIRVETYLKSIKEFRTFIDQLTKERDEWKEKYETWFSAYSKLDDVNINLDEKLTEAVKALLSITKRGKGTGGAVAVTTETLRTIARETLQKLGK